MFEKPVVAVLNYFKTCFFPDPRPLTTCEHKREICISGKDRTHPSCVVSVPFWLRRRRLLLTLAAV